MALDSSQSNLLLGDFVERSRDGYGIYDAHDKLVYCNPAFAELYYAPRDSLLGISFADLIRQAHAAGRAVKIDSGDVEAFVGYAVAVRRSRAFRIFEVDFVDGRWFLFSEQTNAEGALLVQIKEITKQKVLERELETSVTTLSRLALTDELTRAANRRGFVQSVEMELSRCRRTGASMTMALLDLDFFKKVNDRYGHQIGDAALVHVSKLVKQTLREYDIFGRIGGEEFAVFLSNTNQQTALEIAERIRQTIAETPLREEGIEVPMSVSVGITTEGCNTSFEQLYTEADNALYQAKESGRNRVCTYALD